MRTEEQLTRIIELLESIDTSLKRKNARAERLDARQAELGANQYATGIQRHAEALKGRRMTAPEVARAIGLPYEPGNHVQRLALGAALRHTNALRSKSGSTRYYTFPSN